MIKKDSSIKHQVTSIILGYKVRRCLFMLLVTCYLLPVKAQKDTAKTIELSYFDVVPREDHVLISWATKTENNNAYFTIEKSKDGKHFTKVIDIPGAGTCKSFKEYAETDYQPYNNTSYYHIKQTDYNGKIRYFPTSGVIFNGKKEKKPYPSQAEIKMVETAEITVIKNEEVLVLLQDAEGRDFTAKVVITKEGEELFAEDGSKETPPGIYTVLSSSDSSIYSHKIIVK
jgi:fibronectin-binding autotransporter adhesin